MPNATMKKLIGVGNSSDRRKLLKSLTKLGCIEITDCKSEFAEKSQINDSEYDEIVLKLAKLDFAKEFIKEQKVVINGLIKKKVLDIKLEKPNLLGKKPEVDFEDFCNSRDWESEVYDKIALLEEMKSELVEKKSKLSKAKNLLNEVMIYKDLKCKLTDFGATKYTEALIGSIPKSKVLQAQEIENSFADCVIETFGDGQLVALAVLCLRESSEEILSKLADLEFVQNNLYVNTLPSVKISDLEIEIKQLEFEINHVAEVVAKDFITNEFDGKCKLLQDFYNVEMQKLQTQKLMAETKSSFVFEAWYPTTCEETITKVLEESEMSLYFYTREPLEEEVPPTYTMNNALVTSYESVTNMFSVPNYHEIDPNPFVMFFFILFFGVMISDAGYGLLMTLGSGIILAIKKPRKHEMSLVKIILAGGISTIIWGILFGGYFGIDADVINGWFGLPAGTKSWYWFSPLQEPVMMLALSLVLGIIQMLVGMAINAYSLFKTKKPFDAIFGVFSWYVLLLGLGLFAMEGFLFKGNTAMKYSGIAMLAVGLLGLMVAGGLHKKGAKIVSGAFGNLYSIINFFSDLLSYTRLFGLGLATGVIAMVFNQIAMVMIQILPIVGYVVAIFLLLVGHLFNIAINTLGAYVHNSRLQFVEFFGKFYEGGGRLFVPLGSSMKNYNFTLEQSEKQSAK